MYILSYPTKLSFHIHYNPTRYLFISLKISLRYLNVGISQDILGHLGISFWGGLPDVFWQVLMLHQCLLPTWPLILNQLRSLPPRGGKDSKSASGGADLESEQCQPVPHWLARPETEAFSQSPIMRRCVIVPSTT
jgi:hypothetical protein